MTQIVMIKQLVLFAALCCVWRHAEARSKYVTAEEDNPYEFGFTIDGQQHRHEKKDANGIIQGEFGFITADGIYHVTVYATDENGNFRILSMKNVRLSGPLDEPNVKLPDTSQFSKVHPAPSAPLPNPLSVETTPAPPQRIEPVTKSNHFTTQPTIKPACAGCGYVTHATPLKKPDGSLPFQTQAGQNPKPQDVIIEQRPSVQQSNQGQIGVTSRSGLDAPPGSNAPFVSNPTGSSGFQDTLGPNAVGQFNHPNNYSENGHNNSNQNVYNQGKQQNVPGNNQNDNVNTQEYGTPQQAPETHVKINQNLDDYNTQRSVVFENTPKYSAPQEIESDGQRYSEPIKQEPQSIQTLAENQHSLHQEYKNQFTTPEEPANVKYNLRSSSQTPYTPESKEFSVAAYSPPHFSSVEKTMQQQSQEHQQETSQNKSFDQTPQTPQILTNVKYNVEPSTQTPYTSKPQMPILYEQNNQNIGQPLLQQPQILLQQNSRPQQTSTKVQDVSVAYNTQSHHSQQSQPIQNTPSLQHQSQDTLLIPSKLSQPSGNHNAINNQQHQQDPLVNPLTISNSPNYLNQPQSPAQPTSGITVSNGLINVPNNPPIPIQDKFPNMVDGLPAGIKEGDIIDLLYRFNYTVGFHGHYEKGYKNGAKVGGYFVNDRDGVSRIVTYVADENGYRPKVKFIRLDLNSDLVPKEGTEKTFGLKNFEFVWYPLN